MRHGLTHILGNVDGEQQSPLLMTTGADTPLLAGEGHEELVATVGAADTGEALSQVAAPEELIDGCGDDRPPEAELASIALVIHGLEVVEVLANEAVEVRLQWLARSIDPADVAARTLHRSLLRGGPPTLWEPACPERIPLMLGICQVPPA